jgi:hypothetical protein
MCCLDSCQSTHSAEEIEDSCLPFLSKAKDRKQAKNLLYKNQEFIQAKNGGTHL